MVNIPELRGYIVKRCKTQEDIARAVGISSRTFGTRMKTGKFGTDEVEIIIKELEMSTEEAMHIFFAS